MRPFAPESEELWMDVAKTSADEQLAPERIRDAFVEAWNRHDIRTLAALFADDAQFVNVLGMWWKGRDEIQRRLGANHETIFKESHLNPTGQDVYYLRPDVAIVHSTWMLTGQVDRDGEGVADREGIITLVVARGADRWQIHAFQNTDILPVRPPMN
jgi:uncharacterized protein (TIGR02246 family)